MANPLDTAKLVAGLVSFSSCLLQEYTVLLPQQSEFSVEKLGEAQAPVSVLGSLSSWLVAL